MTVWTNSTPLIDTLPTFLNTLEAHVAEAGEGAIIDVTAPPYGAVGDGVADDTDAINAAVAVWALVGGILLFPPGTYLVSGTGILLPGIPAGDTLSGMILGYGAVIKATTACTMMGRPLPANMTEAGNMLNFRFTIQGMKFLGNSTTGQIGLDMLCTYGMAVRDVYFEACDVGFRQTFCLMSSTENCREKICKSYGFEARSGNGLWSGATQANTPSNAAVFRSCRSYGSSGELAQFYVHGSANVRLEDCITEGNNPVNAIKHDDEGSTTCKYFSVKNHHSENTPSNAVLATASMGKVVVEALWHQTNCIMIDATGSNDAAVIHVRDLPWTPGTFKTAGTVTWDFEFPGSSGNANINSTSFWDGGTLPASLHFRDSAGRINNLNIRGNQGGGNGQFNIYADGDDTQPMMSFWGGAGTYLRMGLGGASATDVNLRRDATYGALATDNDWMLAGNGKFMEMRENGTTDPAAGAANTARLYVRDNGAGKSQLCVRFNTGAVQVIATEP